MPDDRLDEALDLLRAFPQASDFSTERGLVRFGLTGTEDDSARMLATVVGAGVPVYEWRAESAGLEELFLRITDGGGD